MFGKDFYDLIESMMPKRKRKQSKRANKAQKCIRSDCNEPRKAGCRDACGHHYNQFEYGRRLAKARGPAALRKYERDEVAACRIGPSKRGCSCKNDYKARAIGATA